MKLNIYAIRDRMVDYYTTPFCAPGDKEVLAAMAQRINQPGSQRDQDAICQAPHHFEIWKLGEVQEDGHIVPKLEFLADCSGLIRGGLRADEQEPARDRPPHGAQIARRSSESGVREDPGTIPAALGNAAQATPGAVKQPHPGSDRGH